jgi:hypothetical protein
MKIAERARWRVQEQPMPVVLSRTRNKAVPNRCIIRWVSSRWDLKPLVYESYIYMEP